MVPYQCYRNGSIRRDPKGLNQTVPSPQGPISIGQTHNNECTIPAEKTGIVSYPDYMEESRGNNTSVGRDERSDEGI